jgi:hypothetical protein
MASNRRASSGANHPAASFITHSTRPAARRSPFRLATASAAEEESDAVMRHAGRSTASAIAIAPDPVPRSAIRASADVTSSSTRSTNSSVSGRGTSTPSLTSRSSDQNSRRPRR